MAPTETSFYRSRSPPIPTYDEATSSNPLLGEHTSLAGSSRHAGYQPPTAQSVRSSEDSLVQFRRDSEDSLTSLESGTDSNSQGLRRDLEDLDYQDGDLELEELGDGTTRRRRRLDSRWKGRLFDLRKRVGKWKQFWSFRTPRWLAAGATRWQCPSVPEEWRSGGSVIGRLVGLFILIGAGYALFALAIFPAAQQELASLFDAESVRGIAQESVSSDRIRTYLQHITSFDHVAGTKGSFYLAEWVKDLFVTAGLDEVKLNEYDVYLNYPRKGGRKVAILDPPELKWEAELEEDPVYPEGDAGKSNTLVFHGHSRNGTVQGPLIYFNYGSRADYKSVCLDSGINCKGAVGLVRYGGTQGDRALKVKAAEDWGIKGVLIYSDPADDGFKKGKTWPDGPGRPADGVQRGAVSLMSWVIGDVLTPNFPSIPGQKRISKDNNPGLVNIPSLPLAWRDAQKLLQSLKGHGQKLPGEWQGAVPDVEWWSGDDKSPTVLLQNEQDEVEQQRIFNVLGKITGMEQSAKAIIVGNHRDSWCFGAADPGSGTAVMLEVMGILGRLKSQGWRPLRSIIFASWDAEEYNMIGSTEWVEEHIDQLRGNGVAYLNVDVAVSGDKFEAQASPLFKRAVLRVLSRVSDPVRNKTFGTIWKEDHSALTGLGAGSDYVAFQDLAGVSSLDFGFSGSQFPYHSCYETFEWMEKFIDPGFKYHKALAEIWVLLILEFSQELLLPFSMLDYASALSKYVKDLQTYSEKNGAPMPDEKGNGGFDLQPIAKAIKVLKQNAHELEDWENWWFGQVFGSGGLETTALAQQRRDHNNRLSNFETDLLDIPRDNNKGPHGIPGRDQFKHVVFGPELWSGYDESNFPFIRDAIDASNWTLAQEQVEKTARIIASASEKLWPK
ncbi:putative glutamate carboxypeptidase Tre2 [Microthyrium microscopicum]|uniref:Putative glutamate carboxypeptidase Tre2 n=1 Tax=Microthyrium microscopicum TaxID=703497 RepID=A0A6A6UKL5_9PEZI|nr:putative glutamate carboxypeptidase Tre2 [Microthyrium microscopicum]